ncbi:MAG: hypothetical protein RL014_2740 [Pseudomonadota bacterium]|jgi:uncharacterized protein (DUF1501 family)
MMHRRGLLAASGAVTAASLLGGLSLPGLAVQDDYRALVVIHLNGGNDGNNLLIPTDGAYKDYQAARQNLAIPLRSLIGLPGTSVGHSFGVHPAMGALAQLYERERLAFIANVGPLIEPATAAQVLRNEVRLPPFLLSHNDQTSMVQGWDVMDPSGSGWAGRGLERIPTDLRHPISAVTMDTNRTLVLGQRSPVSFMPPGGNRWWGTADLAYPETPQAQALNRMARWQFANSYEAEYARTLGSAVSDQTRFVRAFMSAAQPTADFGTDHIGHQLRALASVLPIFRSQGLRRQVFLVHWGGFDTHSNQRGTGVNTQDTQFGALTQALAAFDATNVQTGLDMNVLTIVITEFGRTLRPGSGGGSEHAWGNHWLAIGGPVAGRQVVGEFPQLVLGGPDDGDPGLNGRFVPRISSDQVGATLMRWLGLPAAEELSVFPNLANFARSTVPLLKV